MTPNGRQSSPDAASDTTSRYNGWGQRFLRENDLEQSVFSYGLEGFTLLSQTTRRLATSQQSTTEHIWLPTASGPMPIAAVIDGVHYAVHADHLNTPRRLSDASGQTRWQWPYSGFGEIAPQATPAAGQAPLSFALRYPGQIDDGNELFYNWHRFYEPRVGRYTKADPIGLDGGWNRFGYVGGNPLGFVDPMGLAIGDFPPPPPGYDPSSWTQGNWPNNGKPYLRDPNGGTWTVHPEDEGHWRHWDKQDSDRNDDGTWPPKSKKPWPGQKRLKDGQCETDPNSDAEPWDPMKFDPNPDFPTLWRPSWLSPRLSPSPRYVPRMIPRLVFP